MRKVKLNSTESAVKISENIPQSLGIQVSANTILRDLHAKSLMSAISQRQRGEFVKKYEKYSNIFWNNY